MAGAGYKLFNTGDVLTAAQVNTYLMEQTVMVFANAAARTTALSGVVSEGMISYLKDTNAVEVYDGSNWVSSDDPNAIQNTIVDAKGDLITATAADTPARLAVGNNGESLVADSSTSTGLRWQGNFAAGKNAIINGDFRINQRAFTTSTSSGVYTFDRWITGASDGISTFTAQTFTVGTAPVTGYESKNYIDVASTGQTATSAFTFLGQRIESVRTFANQTVTVSFWAKTTSGTPKVAIEISQNFGTGGSPSASVNTYAGQVTLSTSWTRYSVTVAIPSISGKTLGTANDDQLRLTLWTSAGSDYNSRTGTLGIQTTTIGFWGVQVEAGSVATAFQTATGTLAGELAAAGRYYTRRGGNSVYESLGIGSAASTTQAYIDVQVPTILRDAASIVDYSTLALADGVNTPSAVTNLTITATSKTLVRFEVTVASGLTQYRPYRLVTNNSTSGYIGLSAEL
jgi:hypothetical protein